MKLNLSDDDLTIIGNAITWTLYLPFYRSTPPDFSVQERGRLQAAFESISRIRHEAGTSLDATVDETGLVVQGCTVTSTSEEVRHLILCLQSFYNEVGFSPTEVSVVTGLPISQFDSLLRRLSTLNT